MCAQGIKPLIIRVLVGGLFSLRFVFVERNGEGPVEFYTKEYAKTCVFFSPRQTDLLGVSFWFIKKKRQTLSLKSPVDVVKYDFIHKRFVK